MLGFKHHNLLAFFMQELNVLILISQLISLLGYPIKLIHIATYVCTAEMLTHINANMHSYIPSFTVAQKQIMIILLHFEQDS